MTAGEVAARVTFAATTLAAVLLARPSRAPAHRPVAVALAVALAVDSCRPILEPLGAPLAARRAAYLTFPALSVWLSLEVLVLRRRRAWIARARGAVVGAWVSLAIAVEVLDLPARSPELERFMLCVHLGAVALELGAAAVVALERRIPDVTELVTLLLVAGDLGALAGPWAAPVAWQAWELARWQWAGVYAVAWYVQSRRDRWTATVSARSNRGSSPSGRP